MKIKNYLLQDPVRVAFLARIIAKGIDLFLAGVLSALYYPVGTLLSLVYLSIADSLFEGQSLGKRIMGMAVISLEDGTPCSIKQSAIRNLPFSIPCFFLIIPFWGWVLSLFLGPPLMAFELYLLLRLDSGHRLGDVMADTSVMAPGAKAEGLTRNKQKGPSRGWYT